MNLRSIANRYTQRINPNQGIIGRRYKGMTVGPGRTPIPNYYDDENVIGQLQPLSSKDLQHIDGMNLQNDVQTLFINGAYYGVERKLNKGADLFIIGADTWLVVQVIEMWPNWSRVILNLQVDTDASV